MSFGSRLPGAEIALTALDINALLVILFRTKSLEDLVVEVGLLETTEFFNFFLDTCELLILFHSHENYSLITENHFSQK
jgi:hypothetical protein